MSRGVATILGILCLLGGVLVLWSVFKAQSITETLNKVTGKNTSSGGTITPAGNTNTGTSGGGGQFTRKTQ